MSEAPTAYERFPTHLLLVEDCPGDIRLTQEALRAADSSIQVHVARDGAEAMAFLRHEGAFAAAPRPDLVLLDLNLPKMNGREVLARIKRDDNLKTIPTLVLTTSMAQTDILNSYRLHANSYLTKPIQLDDFEALVKSIHEFWLRSASLPHGRDE